MYYKGVWPSAFAVSICVPDCLFGTPFPLPFGRPIPGLAPPLGMWPYAFGKVLLDQR
jgi:hypothetical protein